MSVLSGYESDLGSLSVQKRLTTPLHERCTLSDMDQLRIAFEEAYEHKMLPEQFRRMLGELLNLEYDDEEFNILFLKINTRRTGEVVWDELVSHLLLGYFGEDPERQRDSLEPPVVRPPRVVRSMHRLPVSKITFCPDVDKNRNTDWMIGNYITASRDGQVNWWSLEMNLLRSGYSTSPNLKVRSTWVTDMVCLPDVGILALSSTERELRFYDTSAQAFNLKIIIASWDYMICTMHYHFFKDEREQSLLLCGDVGGNVRILTFSPHQRGPFQSRASRAFVQLRHVDLVKRPHLLPELRLVEIKSAHAEWVRQVSFYASLHCVVSCATCPDSLLLTGIQGNRTRNMFRVEKGIQCFAFDEAAHALVTGGPDCTVRLWNPLVPTKPTLVLAGHHAGVVALVLQNHGHTIYSLSRDRVLKVWDVATQALVQNYIEIPAAVCERTPLSAVYNPVTRDFIVAAHQIAILLLMEQLNPKHTDGYTHSRSVSKILYNRLFKVVITCGMDSIIINWNPMTGKRNVMIRAAHTRTLHGEEFPVEVTAACFDPGDQLLLTGARDGTLKIWNFNNGECMRKMHVEKNQEITGVFWTEGRIFSVGWSRHITEFDASGTAPAARGKSWDVQHGDDVSAAAARAPLTIATAAYNSELVFWKMETGQAYRRFSCTEPSKRIKMVYSKISKHTRGEPAREIRHPLRRTSHITKKTDTSGSGGSDDDSGPERTCADTSKCLQRLRDAVISPAHAVARALAPCAAPPAHPPAAPVTRPLAVHAMCYLETRPVSSKIASLMVSLENGSIQAWSDHPAGGLRGSFRGVHSQGDYVASLATDARNEFLFAGTTRGYIKVWYMTNYLVNKEVHVSMPRLRLLFPFLWRDRLQGRAKRSVRDQPRPLLLNSYRGHLRNVTALAYIDEMRILLTGGADYSVRLWRLSGEYLQTLGGMCPWTLHRTRTPPDVAKVASSTTLKVWRGGYVSRYVPGQPAPDPAGDVTPGELRARTHGRDLPDLVLGNYFSPPPRPEPQDPIVLDDTLHTIPLFAHVRMASTQPVRRPPTPPLVRKTRLRRARQDAKRTHFAPAPASTPASTPSASTTRHHK